MMDLLWVSFFPCIEFFILCTIEVSPPTHFSLVWETPAGLLALEASRWRGFVVFHFFRHRPLADSILHSSDPDSCVLMCITSGCTVLLSGGNCYQCQLIYPTSKWCSTIPKLSQTRALQTYTLGRPYVEWLCYISFFLSSRASINRKLYYHDGYA